MERHDIITAVTNALTDIAETEAGNVTEETRLFDDTHLDSTSVLELLMHVEDSTGIEVDPDELDMADFATVGALASYLEGQQADTVGAPTSTGR